MYTLIQLTAQHETLKENYIATIVALMSLLPEVSYKPKRQIIYSSMAGNGGRTVFEHIISINTESKHVIVDSIHGDMPVEFWELDIRLLSELVKELEAEIAFRNIKTT